MKIQPIPITSANALNRAFCVVNATIQGRGVGGDDLIGPVKQNMPA